MKKKVKILTEASKNEVRESANPKTMFVIGSIEGPGFSQPIYLIEDEPNSSITLDKDGYYYQNQESSLNDNILKNPKLSENV